LGGRWPYTGSTADPQQGRWGPAKARNGLGPGLLVCGDRV
jgi:hypothetical protein